VGDVISVRLHNDKTKYSFQIKGFEDSVIVVNNYKIRPSEISHIYVDEKIKIWYILKYKYEKIFLIAGAGYFLISLINEGEIHKETAIISGSLITAGLLARLLVNQKIRIRGKKKLALIRSCN
jgi:hypothetical protein